MNFCLGKHLASDRELLMNKRGSPAYVSPDILSAKPYKGKLPYISLYEHSYNLIGCLLSCEAMLSLVNPCRLFGLTATVADNLGN